MNSEKQNQVGDESSCKRGSFPWAPPTGVQLGVSRLWRYRYWLLIAVWVVSCIAFFIFNNKPVVGADGPFTFKLRIEATVSFGLATLIIFIIIHEYNAFMQFLHVQLIQPAAFHLWRFRWVYVLIPVLIISIAVVSIDDYGEWNATRESGNRIWNALSIFYNAKLVVFISALFLIWLVSMIYALGAIKLQWAVALLLLPPLALIFFFHGRQIERQSRVSQAVELWLNWFATHLWLNRWAWVALLSVIFGGLHYVSVAYVFEQEQSHNLKFSKIMFTSLVAALVAVWVFAFFKAWSAQKYLWRLGILLFPPLAFIFFFMS